MKQAFRICALTLVALALTPCRAACTDWLLARNEAVAQTKKHCLVTLINGHQYLREADGTIWNVTVPNTPISHYVGDRVQKMCRDAPVQQSLSQTPDGISAVVFALEGCKVYLRNGQAYSSDSYGDKPAREIKTGTPVTDRFTAALIKAACDVR